MFSGVTGGLVSIGGVVGGGGGGTQFIFFMTFQVSYYVGLKEPWPSGAENQNKFINKLSVYYNLIYKFWNAVY
jgi:hypothetical protein